MTRLWPDYIHRDLPLSKRERKAIHRNAWKLWSSDKWNIVLYLALPASYLLIVPFIGDVGGRVAKLIGVGGLSYKLFRAGAHLVLLLVCYVGGGAILQRARFAPCVYRATRQHGYDVCAKCGYWLKGLGDDISRCPECGTRREAAPPRPE